MYLLLSGEGPADIGSCILIGQNECDGKAFKPGPMAWFVDQWVENSQGFELSHIETELVRFVSKQALVAHVKANGKGSFKLPGKKRSLETSYYYYNARALADKALALTEELEQPVVAVLFRDSDGTASASRGNWQKKVESMKSGFRDAAFDYGVPMIPKPKSEAWLLCATKEEQPYQHCHLLEDMSGNDRGLNPLKDQLQSSLEARATASNLADMVRERQIDIRHIDMPSMNAFKESLACAVRLALTT